VGAATQRTGIMQYGTLYALIDFIDRIVPKSAPSNGPFLKAVMDGLKRVVVVQNANPWFTINVTVTGGVWIFYRNRRRWLINPGQKFLRIENAYGQPTNDPNIEPYLRAGIKRGDITSTQQKWLTGWRVNTAGLSFVWAFIEGLEGPPPDMIFTTNGSHPRYFPGEVRQLALDIFEKEGRVCPGVAKLSKPHKLNIGDPIEFDHVLPYAKDGPSTYRNIQILCVECNRLKRDTAA
jgi:HNH endonuclease